MAHYLHTIDFAIMDTTYKNAAGLLVSLTTLLAKDKETKKDNGGMKKKQLLIYNSVLAIIIYKCLCFLWQDNNTVCAITIAYSLYRQEDQILYEHKRPRSISTNAKQAYVCFEG